MKVSWFNCLSKKKTTPLPEKSSTFFDEHHFDLFQEILSYLDPVSACHAIQVNRNLHSSVSFPWLFQLQCQRVWPWLSFEQQQPQSMRLENSSLFSNSHFWLQAFTVAQAAPFEMETTASLTCPRRNQQSQQQQIVIAIHEQDQDKVYYQFIGRVGRGDRCIRSSLPLPKPRKQYNSISTSSPFSSTCHNTRRPPFVAPFYYYTTVEAATTTSSSRAVSFAPRYVAYFEIVILPCPEQDPDTTTPNNNNNNTSTECVAIGIATRKFPIQSRLPGWDAHSYGYHGDDGGLFHQHGQMVRKYGPQFGSAGDVVGCGIDYHPKHHNKHQASLFFTLNGKHLGTAFRIPNQEDWYPVVGMDTHQPIESNFSGPFVFDLQNYISNKV